MDGRTSLFLSFKTFVKASFTLAKFAAQKTQTKIHPNVLASAFLNSATQIEIILLVSRHQGDQIGRFFCQFGHFWGTFCFIKFLTFSSK
jgi:hypothetical protein